ncbi:MAG: hypothetical protein PHO27_04210 [Sulfuricurvum sp.]|nr:hypothetical protein [Sulfuricurvum sp.]
MNRQTLYLILLSVVLMAGVIGFSFLMLIPKGQEYRSLRLESKKELQKIDLAQRRYDDASDKLKELQARNEHMIHAFNTSFDPERFTHQNKQEFQDLYLTEIASKEDNGTFKLYEVNATSKITSPQSFYNFLEKINKSDWIIGVNFPIHFERDGDKIRSSFTMKVHNSRTSKE